MQPERDQNPYYSPGFCQFEEPIVEGATPSMNGELKKLQAGEVYDTALVTLSISIIYILYRIIIDHIGRISHSRMLVKIYEGL